MGPTPRIASCHPERKHWARGFCKSCYYDKDPIGRAAKTRAQANYRERHPARLKHLQRNVKVRRYGITPEEYRDMVVGQAGRCLICLRVPENDLSIDHDHETGVVRGLLCQSCNLGIGRLGDDPIRVRRALGYLERAAA